MAGRRKRRPGGESARVVARQQPRAAVQVREEEALVEVGPLRADRRRARARAPGRSWPRRATRSAPSTPRPARPKTCVRGPPAPAPARMRAARERAAPPFDGTRRRPRTVTREAHDALPRIRERYASSGGQVAEQVAVAVGVVDARDRRPELVLAQPGRGIRRLLARVRTRPLGRGHRRGRVRRVLERVVLRGPSRPSRRRGSPRGSRSSRRRSGRARPATRSPSARSSACPPPATTSSARGSRSPSAASRRPRPRCRPRLNGRRSTMHSCATRPFLPVYSTG